METSMNTLDLAKKSRGTNLRFIKKVLNKKILKSVFCTHGARAHTLDACLRCESLIKHFTDSTTPPPPPHAWLFGPHHSPQSKPVFIKLLWNVWKADTEEVGVYLGGAKYFMALSIAHCDWVVYAVNAGDKPMGHWLLVVPAWWSLAKNKNKSVGPFSASAHRENARYARLPVQPWLHSMNVCSMNVICYVVIVMWPVTSLPFTNHLLWTKTKVSIGCALWNLTGNRKSSRDFLPTVLWILWI